MTELILSYDCPPEPGGAHLWLYETYRRWPEPVILLTVRAPQSSIVTSAVDTFDRTDHGSIDIRRQLSPLRGFSVGSRHFWLDVIRQVRAIDQILGDSPARIHVVRAVPEGLVALLACMRRPRRRMLVTYAHGEEILVADTSRFMRAVAKTVYRRSDHVICNSRFTQKLLRDFCGVDGHVVHPGVDLDRFKVGTDEVARYRTRWNWPPETVVLATVARMEPRKNQAGVIEAVARLRREGLPVAYVCAGGGPESQRLAELAARLEISDWVKFPGVIPDVEKALLLAAADVHVMPSVRIGEMTEGFGIVFVEAAAVGVPSIAGSAGGQAEAVLDGTTGIVIDGDDSGALADAIRRLAVDPALRIRMGAAARDWAATLEWAQSSKRIRSLVNGLA